jgi:hypothetical protein
MIFKVQSETGASFELNIKERLNFICGKSGTGKTYFCNLLEESTKNKSLERMGMECLVINMANVNDMKHELYDISKTKGKLIVIDDGDSVFWRSPELTQIIEEDPSNTYIICMRNPYRFSLQPANYAEFVNRNGTITLKYKDEG